MKDNIYVRLSYNSIAGRFYFDTSHNTPDKCGWVTIDSLHNPQVWELFITCMMEKYPDKLTRTVTPRHYGKGIPAETIRKDFETWICGYEAGEMVSSPVKTDKIGDIDTTGQ